MKGILKIKDNKIVVEYTYKDGTIQLVPLREQDCEFYKDRIGKEVDFEVCVVKSASGGVYPLNKVKII